MKNTLWNWNTTEAKRGQQRDVDIDTIKILLAFAAIVAIVIGAALGSIALAGVGFIGLLALIVPLLPNTRLNSRLRLKPRSRYIPQDVKIAVSVRDGGKCRICGSTKGLHYDHIFPYSLGGRSDVDNIQLLCSRHNLSKGNRYIG
jgi:hypothetical protein